MGKRGRADDEDDEGTQVTRTPNGGTEPAKAGDSGQKKKKKKTKLGRKEREKLKLKKLAEAASDVESAPSAGKNKNGDGNDESDSGEDGGEKGKSGEKRQRYTIFVGNLPYDADKQEIHDHFDRSLHGQVLQVRVMTDRGTDNFRGTAFVDLKDKEAYGKALKLHHTKLQDRKINVEPTVGGGGKGQNRAFKLFEKTRKIAERRKKRTRKEGVNPHKQAKSKSCGDGAKSTAVE